MKPYAVVINDCATPAVPAIRYVRTIGTEFSDRNFSLRFDDLVTGLPRLLTERELDWLEILGHLFAIDMACDRGAGDVDWNRSIQAWLPVRDPAYWNTRRSGIAGIWTDLTDDDLEIIFEPAPNPAAVPRMGTSPFPEHDGVGLLSGGQDSFVGALELASTGREPLLLSHTASGATNTAQAKVEEHLRALHPDLHRMKLSARKKNDAGFPGDESSQRSRTFLFVGAACVVAAAGGSNQVWLNENGIMALHVPMTAARIGSLSTHTASPPIVERMRALASDVLGVELRVDNHLVTRTKPEVVELAVNLGARDQLQDTVSCWAIGRSRTHCGTCAPCLLRRISCETHGVADVDYKADVFDDPAAINDPRARDNLTHLIAFVEDLCELDDVELEYEYPDLVSGEPAMSLAEAIAMHRRWADQASAVLFQPPRPDVAAMTRITFGLYRRGIREPTITLSGTAGGYIPPTPFPSASAAVTRYHREDGTTAATTLDRSLSSSDYWGPSGTPQARGWADAIRTCFDIYRQIADADTRPAFATGLSRTLAMPPDELVVYIDVVLIDPRGYVPRAVLWDTADFTDERAVLYAAPVWRVMEDELGDGRIPEVEVWHLRTGAQRSVHAATAAAALPDVARIVHRLST